MYFKKIVLSKNFIYKLMKLRSREFILNLNYTAKIITELVGKLSPNPMHCLLIFINFLTHIELKAERFLVPVCYKPLEMLEQLKNLRVKLFLLPIPI